MPEIESNASSKSWPDYRAVWRWHFYAGMICLPFVIILSISGSLYLFKPQIEAWIDAPYDHLTIQNRPTSAESQVRAALTAFPGAGLNAYEIPVSVDSAARVLLNDHGQTVRVYVHPETLQVLNSIQESERLMRVIFRLHGELLLGARGSNLVELAASWTIILILTGLFLWWPRQSRGWGGIAYPRFWNGSRLFWRDIHSVTGFWISGFALILLLSGLPWAKFWGDYFKLVRRLTGTSVARQDWSNGSESAAGRKPRGGDSGGHGDHGGGRRRTTEDTPIPKDLAAIDRILSTVSPLNLPPPVLIAPPSRPGSDWTVKSNTPNRPLRVNLVVNGTTGKIVSRDDFQDKHLLDKIVAVGIALHEGQLFGWPNQLVGLLTASGLVLLSCSGIVIWWKRKDPRVLGAPKPGIPPRFSRGLLTIVIALGLYLPLFGASLLAILVLEQLVLRRIPGVRDWLGLRVSAPADPGTSFASPPRWSSET